MSESELHALSDSEVLSWARMTNDDLLEAANTAPNSQWHEACFAACFIFSNEMARRDIRLVKLQ